MDAKPHAVLFRDKEDNNNNMISDNKNNTKNKIAQRKDLDAYNSDEESYFANPHRGLRSKRMRASSNALR